MEVYNIRKQLAACCIIYTGQILVGYGLGWTAPIIPKLQDLEQTPLPDVISDEQSSWIGSVIFIGSVTGPYVSGYISNVRGRKPSLFIGAVLSIFSLILLALAQNLAMILIGRVIIGLGAGMIFVINLVYIGEIASTHIRGILLTGTGIFTTFGTLVVYSVGPFVSYAVTSWVGLAITIAYFGGLFFIPESPVFQATIGQEQEATDTLIALGRKNDVNEIVTLKKDEKVEIEEKSQWRDLFKEKSNKKALFITLTLNILQQLSGIIVVVFFATRIFELAGSSIEPSKATIIIGITQLVASSIAPVFVERSGRKILLLISTASCCVVLAVLGVYFFLENRNFAIVNSIQWLPLVILIIFFLTCGFGFSIIPVVFIGEMFQSNVRSSGSAFIITSGWLVSFGISSAFGYMLSGLGADITFWFFSLACAAAFLFTLLCVPETKGKSFAEIQELLSK